MRFFFKTMILRKILISNIDFDHLWKSNDFHQQINMVSHLLDFGTDLYMATAP